MGERPVISRGDREVVEATIHIDLTGSRLGPKWRSVEVDVAIAPTTNRFALRYQAADYYGIPVDQVGPVEVHDA